MDNSRVVVLGLLERFGDEAKIKQIAQYAEDEFMIPYQEAVNIIVETIDCSS